MPLDRLRRPSSFGAAVAIGEKSGPCLSPLGDADGSTPVGFESTQGDPIGLAGRRLNHSAKVSLTRSTRNHGTQTSAHTNAHTPATHAPLHTTRAPSGNTTQTLARPTGERTNMHAANTRRCNTPIGVANGKRPRGPMDEASAHGAGDCRFESCRGDLHNTPACRCHLHSSPAAKPPAANTNKPTPRGFEPLRAEPNGFRVHLLNRSDTVSWQQSPGMHAKPCKTHIARNSATVILCGCQIGPTRA